MSSDAPLPTTADDLQVRLKPLFGIEPKHYLAGIYGTIVLVALFSLVFLPGILSPGTKTTVTSIPPGAAVFAGEKPLGVTPLTSFLPEGKTVLTVSKPGFAPFRQEYVSGNNLVLSLFWPHSDTVATVLVPESDYSLETHYRTEVGRWSLTVPFLSSYRFPPLFTRFVLDARAAGWNADRIKTFLLDLRQAVADPQMYLDYGRALGLWAVDAPVPGSLEAQYQLWEPLVGAQDSRLALWILANQTRVSRDRETAEPSDWLRGRMAEFQKSVAFTAPAKAPLAPKGSIKAPAGTFRPVADSAFLWGDRRSPAAGKPAPEAEIPLEPPFLLPVPVVTQAFWIAEQEVTQGEFGAFVVANPSWAPSALPKRIADGQCDVDYLRSWTGGTPPVPSAPVDSVSWYAAQAYVDWINATGRVPAGKKAVLPDEFQWEAAARAPGGSTLLNQGVWEWTATAWYPGQALTATAQPGKDGVEAYARSIKGGTRPNSADAKDKVAKDLVKAGDRAGWPAGATNSGLGFRLALVSTP